MATCQNLREQLVVANCSPGIRATNTTVGNAECAAKQQQITQKQNDYNTSQTEYDRTCDSVGAYERKVQSVRSTFQTYRNDTQKVVDSITTIFNTRIEMADKLSVAYNELQKVLTDVSDQYEKMDKSNTDLDQIARTQRRLFLDDSPQSGIGGLPGIRTTDDRILFTFWINYGAALIAMSLFFCWRQGMNRMETILITVIATGIGYLTAYYFIAKYS